MAVAYVDTSCLVAIAFGEAGAVATAARLAAFDEVFASNLLEAELLSACARTFTRVDPRWLALATWVFPDRPMTAEMHRVLAAGYLRGADLWHVATALYIADDPATFTFVTLDVRQRAVAAALGFAT